MSLIGTVILASTTATAAAAATSAAATSTPATAFPVNPPAAICGVSSILDGPATAPAHAITVKKGDNSAVNWNQPGATFWLAAGTHTLGSGQYSQIVPGNNETFIGAPGAIISGQGLNEYAFTQTATGVTIEYLTIENFVAPRDQGVVNHDSGVNWTIEYNTITADQGAGVMVGPNNLVAYNCLSDNGQYGFSAYYQNGDSNITIDHNEITGNNTGNWDVVLPGCGCVGGGKIWNTTNGSITNNWVHNNIGPGIWVDTDNAGILINGNYINNNDDEAIIYEISYNGAITDNNLLNNGYVEGQSFAASGSTFPLGAIYISNSGGDSRVDGGLYATFNISGNNLNDNWGGVTLWQDANRFCGSDSTSTFCTLVNPAANLSTCVAGTINSPPYLADCLWKTQNISVTGNTFTFSPAAVGCTTTGCGMNAIVSNYGNSPSWSPYLGDAIINTIASQQHNTFGDNTYVGTWQFEAGGGAVLNFSSWQGNPYYQDAGSTMNGETGTPNPNNLLDADTSTLENSIGLWAPWFSDTVAQSTAQAEAGTHSLQVNITAAYGWGIQTANWPGFAASPGPATISFWGLAGPGTTNVGTTMSVLWRDSSGNLLATSTASVASLTSTWQQGSAVVTAPAGTAFVSVTFTGTTGVNGNSLYLDQIGVSPGTAPPPPPPSNLLDADTSGLEGSVGQWIPWFSDTVAQSTSQAEAGTHSLQVNINAAYGWGVQTANWPGFSATPGPETISFWALAGNGTTNLNATMSVQWRDTSGNVLATTTASLATLTGSWQQATATGTAPAGTAYVSVTFSGSTGVNGNTLYLDQIVVAHASTSGVNLLGSDTAGLEGSIGTWIPWFSDTIAQSTSQAEAGSHSLLVNITAAYGWGVQQSNWPGFTAAPGSQTISFWGLAGSASPGLNATMTVIWRDTSGNTLATNTVTLPNLTTTWQQAIATVSAPAGTAYVGVTLSGTTGVNGNSLYLDQLYVGS